MKSMKTITCPRCGSAVPLRRGFGMAKPFCARCGWNLARAEAGASGKNMVLILVALAMAALAMFAAFAMTQSKFRVSLAFYLVPIAFGAIFLIPLWGFYSTRKMLAAARLSANPDLALAQPPLDPALQQLQVLTRPRRVRFRFGGNLALGVAGLVTAVLLGFGVLFLVSSSGPRTAPHPASLFPMLVPALLILVVFPLVIALPFIREKRNIPLLRDGEFAFGRVTSQQTVQQGKTSYSSIAYEFKTGSGQMMQNTAKDLSYSVFEDMIIPVFYDPADPSKNIPLCATYLRISIDPF